MLRRQPPLYKEAMKGLVAVFSFAEAGKALLPRSRAQSHYQVLNKMDEVVACAGCLRRQGGAVKGLAFGGQLRRRQ